MRTRIAALLAAWLLTACTETSLSPMGHVEPPRDDRLAVSGQFCTPAPVPEEFPVRVLFIVDISQSMTITDPPPVVCPTAACFSRRGQAVEDILNAYPAGNGVRYSLVTFSSDSSVVTRNELGEAGFTASTDEVKTKLPTLSNAVGETNFEGVLQTAYEVLQTDMIALDATARSRARYVIVFVSDGLPSPRTEERGLPDDVRKAVEDIAGLERQQRLAEVALHTVYLASPDSPLAVQLAAQELMAEVARIGGGTFRSFGATESINLFYIDFTSFMRTFALKRFVVSNQNARPLDGRSGVDTDGDGLLDDEETVAGTSREMVDTDGDGFSDMLEVRLRTSGFDPLFPGDADCALGVDKMDDDGDGLLNCEERYLGSNARLLDSDADGTTDDIEVRLGTNPTVADDLDDGDFDGMANGVESMSHTDPTRNDIADFSSIAYRYDVKLSRDGTAPPGQLCYDFDVANVTLVPAGTAVGQRAGTNTVLLRVVAFPSDSPDDFGTHLVACVRPTYSLNPESKVPPSGRIAVSRTAFKKPVSSTTPNDPEAFDATRDCIVP